jgi:hypothetical protein
MNQQNKTKGSKGDAYNAHITNTEHPNAQAEITE